MDTMSIKEYCVEKGFSGSLVVQSENLPSFHEAFGNASREHSTPNTVETQFHVGSITKQVTAIAILMLQESKELNVAHCLRQYFPSYSAGKDVTIRQLLSHTSGIKNFTNYFEFDSPEFAGIDHVDALVDLFSSWPLNFKPGLKFEYSNSGYVLLGAIIEKVTGQIYWDFLEQNIFEPLNMKASGAENSLKILDLATGYFQSGEVATHINPYVRYAAGGLISTTGDLSKWNSAVLNHILLSEELTQAMFTPSIGRYGLGWRISQNIECCYFHGGAVAGFSAFNVIRQKERCNISVLSNIGDYDVAGLAFEVHQRLVDGST